MSDRNWNWLTRLLDQVSFSADASIVVLIGLPLVGKSTLSRQAGAKFALGHLSTGDWFRNQIAERTILGKRIEKPVLNGDLLPTPFAQLAVAKALSANGQSFRSGILFDGFPRNIEQALLLDLLASRFGLPIKAALHLSSQAGDLLIRAEMRRVCSNPACKEAYGWALPEPITPEVCNKCKTALQRRPDDNLEILRKRISQGAPRDEALAVFYADRGLLDTIDAGNHINLQDALSASMRVLSKRLHAPPNAAD